MRVLIVEDDELLARSLAERIGTQLPHPDIVFARSHTEAIEAVDSRAFDAAVVDLRLPSQLDAGDATLDFGLAVEAYLVKVQPGAFRLFLTASDAKVVVQRLRMGQFDDFFSNDDAFAIVDYVQKEGVASLDECVDRLKQHHARLAGLDSIRLDGAEASISTADAPLPSRFGSPVVAKVECLDRMGSRAASPLLSPASMTTAARSATLSASRAQAMKSTGSTTDIGRLSFNFRQLCVRSSRGCCMSASEEPKRWYSRRHLRREPSSTSSRPILRGPQSWLSACRRPLRHGEWARRPSRSISVRLSRSH